MCSTNLLVEQQAQVEKPFLLYKILKIVVTVETDRSEEYVLLFYLNTQYIFVLMTKMKTLNPFSEEKNR